MIDTYSSSLSLVRRLLAARLHLDEDLIKEADRFDELGLTPLDVALVMLRLRRRGPDSTDFPLYALDFATTVGHLAELVDLWLLGRSPHEGIGAAQTKT